MDWVTDFLGDEKKGLEIGTQVLHDLGGKMLIVKVGNEDRPASDKDVKSVQAALAAAVSMLDKSQRPATTLVTHHAISLETMDTDTAFRLLGDKYTKLSDEEE